MSRLSASAQFAALSEREIERFRARTPRSQAAFEEASATLFNGVPMPWMSEWPNPSPLYVREARGARVRDVDGNEYVDFCLGDTGAMFGHSPQPVAEAVAARVSEGITTMLPGVESARLGALLAERFGLPHWQLAMTATDANRFVMRIARALTERPKVLVFNGCYHGSLDEALVDLRNGALVKRSPVDVNPAWSPEAALRIVEFNDVEALEDALGEGDVACVLAEPVMTNCGMVLPDDGFHDRLRTLTRRNGTLLVIDETHTWSAGYGGYTKAHGLEPDFLTVGKAIAGGIPIAAYGFTSELADAMNHSFGSLPVSGEMGIGGTLTANAFAVAAAVANLRLVATAEAFDHMIRLADQLDGLLTRAIDAAGLPWSVTRCGARAEIQYLADPPRTGGEALAGLDGDLTRHAHLYLMNRGVLITPFHNMMLVSPATTPRDVALLVETWASCMDELSGLGGRE